MLVLVRTWRGRSDRRHHGQQDPQCGGDPSGGRESPRYRLHGDGRQLSHRTAQDPPLRGPATAPSLLRGGGPLRSRPHLEDRPGGGAASGVTTGSASSSICSFSSST